jgi:hypothetical protein
VTGLTNVQLHGSVDAGRADGIVDGDDRKHNRNRCDKDGAADSAGREGLGRTEPDHGDGDKGCRQPGAGECATDRARR